MSDYTNHLAREKLNQLMHRWHIRVIMAKGLFWVSLSVTALVWAIKS